MRLISPCNKCIVKPMCKIACPPYEEYTAMWFNKLKWIAGALWEEFLDNTNAHICITLCTVVVTVTIFLMLI